MNMTAMQGAMPKAEKAAKKKPSKKMLHLSIDEADNGFTARCSYSGGKEEMGSYDSGDNLVFASKDDLLEYLQDEIGGKMEGADEDADDD